MQLLKLKNLIIYLALLLFALALLFQKSDHHNRTEFLLGMGTSILVIGILYRLAFSGSKKTTQSY